MLQENDEQWLREAHPALLREGDAVVGTIQFEASYDQRSNRFFILDGRATSPPTAVAFSGSFQIRIQERTDKSFSSLPAVYVEGIDAILDRHFGPADKSACLCSPFEEDEFLKPEFKFRLFLEQLVIPFLYGQLFFSTNQRWPWPEYSHGEIGILEAYGKISDQNRAAECVQKLKRYASWARVQSALEQEPYTKGHTLCFCPKRDQIRRCHPVALKGVLRLQQDLRALRVPIS